MEASQLDAMLAHAERLASVLADTEHMLPPWSVTNAIDGSRAAGVARH